MRPRAGSQGLTGIDAVNKDILSGFILLIVAGAYYWATLQIPDSSLSDEVGAQGQQLAETTVHLKKRLMAKAGVEVSKIGPCYGRTVEERPAPLIAILNGTADILETLEECLRGEGYNTITAIVSEFKKGKEDFVEFMKRHNPALVIYDVPPPYDQNMTFLRLLLDTHAMDERCVLLTTTNKAQLERVTGEKAAIEIVGKPFDLNQLVEAIGAKLTDCAPKAK